MDKNEWSILLQEIIIKMLRKNVTSVSKSLKKKIFNQIELEKKHNNSIAAVQLETIIENIDFGEKNEIPICQDTGMINIIVKFPPGFSFPAGFKSILTKSIEIATSSIPLRPNAIDPITNKNSNNNTGINTPPIYYELDESFPFLRIYLINKGGGSENMSRLFMMPATSTLKNVTEKIKELVKFAGGKPCPPILLGIGIGGDAAYAMYLAKKALLRPNFSRNNEKVISEFEDEVVTELNKLNVGPMGMGGITTCLDARCEYAYHHPASYPVGVIIQCYSHRVVSAEILDDGSYKIIQE